MNTLKMGAVALAFLGIMLVPSTQAHAATVDEMLTQIKTLMSQIEELQKQLSTIKGEVKSVIKDGLKEGMTDADIAKIQELLATDPTLYPEGKKTGFFGPLTKEAVKRFQVRHELEVTGEVDQETRDLLEEYLHEGFGNTIPPGLLRAPGIMKKVEMRFELGCDKRGHGMGPLCKKLRTEHGTTTDDSDDDADATSTDDFNVEAEVEHGTTTVTFTIDNDDHEVVVHSIRPAIVLIAVADELDTTVQKLDSDLKNDIKDALAKALKSSTSAKAKEDAEDALDDAEAAIEDAATAIEDATGDTSDAEALLEDAATKFDDAQAAFDAGNYATAKELAKDAEDLAKDAEDAV